MQARTRRRATTEELPRSPGRPRTKPPETRREELMDGAQNLFLQKGIAATSIDEIVNAAGVAKGTFYLYFQSKEVLLAAIQERFVVAFCARVQAAMDKHRPDQWRERLRTWVKTAVETYYDNLHLHDVIFHEFQPEDRRSLNDNLLVDQLTEMLRAGTSAETWKVDDPKLTAIMLFHALHGAVDDGVTRGEHFNRTRLIRTLCTFFERAVGTP